MGIVGYSGLVLLTAISVKVVPTFFETRPPLNLQGTVQRRFNKVQQVFKSNFINGGEQEGAAFAVYHKGELVVDLWGGYAEKAMVKPWVKDTMTVAFSVTKGVCAVCVAMLVDRGHLKYNDLVTQYWPEFGKHGKANVTVAMLLSHQAGVAAIDEQITKEDVLTNWRSLGEKLANQVPNWPPGRGVGYHAITFGWLADQLVRRVDPMHRSVGQFFREEVAKPHNIDFHIGLSPSEYYRVARHGWPSNWMLLNKLNDWNTIKRQVNHFIARIRGESLLSASFRNPKWLVLHTKTPVMNDPDILKMEIGAGNGVGTARSLARLFSLLQQGQIVKQKSLLEQIATPSLLKEVDKAIGIPLNYGAGFMYAKNPMGNWQLGHPGYGGQNVKADPANDLAFAYLTNGLTPDMGDNARNFASLQKALYDCLQ